MKPHKHAKLIKAWADGAEIEYRFLNNVTQEWGRWQSSPQESIFIWHENFNTEYRIKPQPKPDFVKYCQVRLIDCQIYRHKDDNLVLLFDGETEKLKSAEVIK